ncbi:hypothetical protein BZA70DRAFT_115435 [Myxozyma melibiosi]|uniref:F-box domain-containing protein n=1 Tax=Myxozyma melibiosi TaxID=54550 RepID=A0ABR1FAG9_9ASCO
MSTATDELAKFRSEWEKEVLERKRTARSSAHAGSAKGKGTGSEVQAEGSALQTSAQTTASGVSGSHESPESLKVQEPNALEEDTRGAESEEDEDVEIEVEAEEEEEDEEDALLEEELESSTEELVQNMTDLNLELELQAAAAPSAAAARNADTLSSSTVAASADTEEHSLGTADQEPNQKESGKESPAAELPMDYADLSENLLAAEAGGNLEVSRAQRALLVYELAVEKERVGNLSDALRFYRQAFRLDETVDKLYKNKHFPASSFKRAPSPSRKAATSSLPTDKTTSILSEYSNLEAMPEDEDVPSPFINMPNEVTSAILRTLALSDLSSFTKATYTCRKLAFLGYSDVPLWKALCMREYPRMNYEEEVDEYEAVALWNHDWRRMFLERPRVQFNGIYISTCNYHRYGHSDSWNAPIHIITYYRYLRFYDDGTCITHLTSREPIEVVSEFHRHLMRRGMYRGTWVMSMDGRIRIESQAPVAKYLFLQELEIKSSGRGRHNRVNWVSFSSFNRLTEERMEFSLQHDKPFYFSRVLSYDRPPKNFAEVATPSAVPVGGSGVIAGGAVGVQAASVRG